MTFKKDGISCWKQRACVTEVHYECASVFGAFMLVFKRQHKPEHRSSRDDATQAMPGYLWTTCLMLIHVSFACVL